MGTYDLFSSRRCKKDLSLGSEFLCPELDGATSYMRIAGYFCTSIIEVAGSELDKIIERKGAIRVVCNARLDFVDTETLSISASALDEFLWQEWQTFKKERVRSVDPVRFSRLHRLMKDGLMEVRVLHDGEVGLLHGKAGLIEKGGISKAFLGSANESISGWQRNYELLAASNDQALCRFVQEEFDALWVMAQPIPQRIVDDFGRLANRKEISISQWIADPDINPGPALLDCNTSDITPMSFQKWFIDMAFRDHRTFPWGARYVLADPVGLGKTIQLGMAMKLMALWAEKDTPLLAVVPKTLVIQWQGELRRMGIPSSRWDNGKKVWISEDDSKSARVNGSGDIPNCPRRIGIVSSGLISRTNKMSEFLLSKHFECVVIDEAHHARRHLLSNSPYSKGRLGEQRNLLKFLRQIATRTKSMILATATPIQIHPIEAWDLLDVLSQGNSAVLGENEMSKWSSSPESAIDFLMSTEKNAPGRIKDNRDRWEWLRNPLPFPRYKSNGDIADSQLPFQSIRQIIGMPTQACNSQIGTAPSCEYNLEKINNIESQINRLWGDPVKDVQNSILRHTPFVRRIVRRSRDTLERKNILRKIEIDLRGESTPLPSPDYLKEAFKIAHDFCNSLTNLPKGFMKTLLLRRVGSSKNAGLETARRMLERWDGASDDENEEDDDFYDAEKIVVLPVKLLNKKDQKKLTTEQRNILEEFARAIEVSGDDDPKLNRLLCLLSSGDADHLNDRPWIKDGVIIFSQYLDTADHFARKTSKALPSELIALYAGAGRSMLFHEERGIACDIDRDVIKRMAVSGELRVIFGTDAASEGLNLQIFGALINLDLPWNPTRLEQRKGRIQRPGQCLDTIRIYNMRYEGSVEDDVHIKLSKRLKEICDLLGQIPDCLESVWILIAQGEEEEAKKRIKEIVSTNPLKSFYDEEILNEEVCWDEAGTVLNGVEVTKKLMGSWY